MKVTQEQLADWTARSEEVLRRYNSTRDMVTRGCDAWTVAHKAGYWAQANQAGLSDGHVQTALSIIFPNVSFNDARRY